MNWWEPPSGRLIVALDVPGEGEVVDLVDRLSGMVRCFKIGLQAFTALGPRAVQIVTGSGAKVFLDLKFHDIPNTVARAAKAAARLGVSLLTVHASGGAAMLEAAKEALVRESSEAKLLAVTVLTSVDERVAREELGLSGPLEEMVLRWAAMARGCGVDGVVASASEAPRIKSEFGRDFLVVTPGIRTRGEDVHDQKRVATPYDAIRAGSDMLVVGRPVTATPDPRAAARSIIEEIGSALAAMTSPAGSPLS